MKALLVSGYILVWPLISTGILALLVVALIRDLRNARLNGEEMI